MPQNTASRYGLLSIALVMAAGTSLAQTKSGIYALDRAGSSPTLLRAVPWSPGGFSYDTVSVSAADSSIIYNTRGDVYKTSLDGQATPVKLTSSGIVAEAHASRNTKRLVFNEVQGFKRPMYLINTDGTGRTPLGLDGWQPKISPDGNKILYLAAGPAHADFNLYVVGADGTNPKVVASENGGVIAASFNKKQDRVVYSVTRTPNGKDAIYTIDLDGNNKRLVFEHDTWCWYEPTFTPEGSDVIFSGCVPPSSKQVFQLFQIPTSGGTPSLLTTLPNLTFFPAPDFSPDETQIIAAGAGADGAKTSKAIKRPRSTK